MTPHETGSTATPGAPRATVPLTRTFGPQGPTLGDLIDAYLQDYQVRQFRSHSTARGRVAHLAAFFGRAARAAALTTHQIRQYQLARRAAGAATGTINRETSALHRMCTLAVHWGWLDTVPGFPDRLRENPPRQGFFEHPEYLAVRAHLPAPWQDILDLAYYSGWRKQEILGLTWDEIDEAGGVIRLSPARSKTLVGRILPISPPIAEALARRRARRDPTSPLVNKRVVRCAAFVCRTWPSRAGKSDISADTLGPTLTMPSPMSPARAAVHRALPVVVAPLLCACAGVDGWPAAGRSTNPVAPVAARYQGEEAVPNPANPMVGLRFTGKPCDAVVRVDDSGAARVESSFVPDRVVDLTPAADTFYLGDLGGGSALVVQFDGDGALLALTYTSYDEAGDLNYGVSGAGTFIKECVQIKRLE